MKNSQIHTGLPYDILRDFLSMGMLKNFEDQINNKQTSTTHNGDDHIDRAIKDCENTIEYHTERLKLLKEQQAFNTLIKRQGWEKFDVSDETDNDTGYKMWMSFIGTKNEYDKFIEQTLENK